MKFSTYVTFIIFSILFSCQKKDQGNKSSQQEDAKDYLEISLKNNSVFIGRLNSINENIKKDYIIIKKNDTLFIAKNFLESDDLDGKEITLRGKKIKKIKIQYNIGYVFNGTEKENKYLNFNYIYPTSLSSQNLLPDFKSIKQNKDVNKYLSKNSAFIKMLAYNNYINYFKNISESDLKNCCISDYLNFSRIKNIPISKIGSLNLEEDLATRLDYRSIVIDITTISNQKIVIVFTKENQTEKRSDQIDKPEHQNNQNIKPNTWKGSYEISTKAISEYDNKQFTIYYNINIESETSAVLSIDAKHSEDYWCEGNYRLTIENNIIHAKGKCDQDDINDFYIKYSDGSYFIKSKRFENQDWLQIIKK